MSELNYKIEPAYCGDCMHFKNEADGYGTCKKDGGEAWQGEIACEDFVRKEDEGDDEC